MTQKLKTRVPDDLTDERAMRAFHDQLDRRHLKVGELEDVPGGGTTADLIDKVNALLAIFRTR